MDMHNIRHNYVGTCYIMRTIFLLLYMYGPEAQGMNINEI
jgi:hypothetical protein